MASTVSGFSNQQDGTDPQNLIEIEPKTSILAQTNTKIQAEKIPLYYFGTTPHQKGQSIDKIRKLYRPMLKWLGEQLSCRFHFIGADTYEEMIEMVVAGNVHFAVLGPAPFLEAKQRNPDIKLLLTELRWDKNKKNLIDSYNGYILVLKNREDLKSLLDLKDQKFAFVNHHSTCGYRYPYALMREKGIKPENFFSKFYFLGSHPRVTDAIVAGSVDAGATWYYNWSRAEKKHGDVFKPILKTPPVPNLAIAAHPSLPDDICLKIQKVLPMIDPSLLKGLPSAGFVIRPDSFYNKIKILFE